MLQQTTCPRCAKRLPGKAQFCRRCGMALKPAPAAAPSPRSTGSFGTPGTPRSTGRPPTSDRFAGFEEPAGAGGAAGSGRSTPPTVTYYPAAARPGKKPHAGPSGKGWWVFAVLLIFIVRACMISNERAKPRYTPPPVYQPPQSPQSPWPNLQDPQFRDPFKDDKWDVPAPPGPAVPPAPPLGPWSPKPPDRLLPNGSPNGVPSPGHTDQTDQRDGSLHPFGQPWPPDPVPVPRNGKGVGSGDNW